MPQMAPMSWLTLMLLFMTTMIIINTMMYFNKDYKNKNMEKNIMKKNFNWKW
uniref:ATP synthase F0 subunit 8 n=1 Tax=Halovelia novoguinensis TaxID=2866978 RepID=UPI001EDF3B38|nr:ATP synthase F0 subunit 8 [Halovelia novoguinensis]UIG88257.1 ATP synthase F0 subunit 8 [Halovelia novoguinensis]